MSEPTVPSVTTPLSVAAAAIPSVAGPVGHAWACVRAGRIRSADHELNRLLRAEGDAALTPDQLALALLLHVEVDLASGELGPAAARSGRLGDVEGAVAALAAELAGAETAAAYGDHATARDRFLAAGTLAGSEEQFVRPWWVGAVLALVRTGRRSEGADLAHSQVALAERAGDPYVLAHGLRALATADPAQAPLELLRRARTLAQEAGAQRLVSQLDTDVAALGILAPADPDPEVAARLRRAEVYAVEEALWPLHSRIVGLRVRAGEQPRPVAGVALEVLTEAERRVARLTARSMSNREIAGELGVSIKAVEWHLSRIYRKLEIRSRQELIALLDAPPD